MIYQGLKEIENNILSRYPDEPITLFVPKLNKTFSTKDPVLTEDNFGNQFFLLEEYDEDNGKKNQSSTQNTFLPIDSIKSLPDKEDDNKNKEDNKTDIQSSNEKENLSKGNETKENIEQNTSDKSSKKKDKEKDKNKLSLKEKIEKKIKESKEITFSDFRIGNKNTKNKKSDKDSEEKTDSDNTKTKNIIDKKENKEISDSSLDTTLSEKDDASSRDTDKTDNSLDKKEKATEETTASIDSLIDDDEEENTKDNKADKDKKDDKSTSKSSSSLLFIRTGKDTPSDSSDDSPKLNKLPVYIKINNSLQEITVDEIEGSTIIAKTKATNRFKLVDKEKNAIIGMSLIQNLIFALIGFIVIFVPGITVMNFVTLILPVFRISLLDMPIFSQVLWGIFALATLLIVLFCGNAIIQKASPNAEKYRKAQVQSITGEMVQLPLIGQIVVFLATGIGEEMLFRFGIMGILTYLFSDFGIVITLLLSIGISSIIFTACHWGSNRSIASLIIIFLHSVVLGTLWILTGDIIVPIIVHFLYDLIVILIEKQKMVENPVKFFFGKKPINLMNENKDYPRYVIIEKR